MSMTSDLLEELQWDEDGHFWSTSDGIKVEPRQLLKLTVSLVKHSDAVHEAMWAMEVVAPEFRIALAAFERYFEKQARAAGL